MTIYTQDADGKFIEGTPFDPIDIQNQIDALIATRDAQITAITEDAQAQIAPLQARLDAAVAQVPAIQEILSPALVVKPPAVKPLAMDAPTQ